MRRIFFTIAITSTLVNLACAPATPVISDLELQQNPNPSVPLAATIHLSTDLPTRITLEIGDDESTKSIPVSSEPATRHEVPVLGLRPDRDHILRVRATTPEGGEAISRDLQMQTDPLPADFPPLEIWIARPTLREQGVLMVPTYRWTASGPDREFGLVLGLDASGDVVWYYRTDHPISEPQVTAAGNLTYLSSRDGQMWEIDLFGNMIRRWHTTGIKKEVPPESIPIDTDTLHHDYAVLPSGNFLALGSEARRYESYPSSEEDARAPRKPHDVIGDLIVEFDPAGNVIRQWRLLDILDPFRLGPSSLSTGFWAKTYEEILDEPGYDWAHANSLIYDDRDSSAILSLNHQAAIVKIDLETGELEWILGDPAGWKEPWSAKLLTPVGDVVWPYSQHAAKLTPEGRILLFDNGSALGIPAHEPTRSEPRHSRAVMYEVDEAKGEVRQVWSFGSPEKELFYSSFLSDTDWLPATGNIMVTAGARKRPQDDAKDGRMWAHIFEVQLLPDSEDQKVFELVIDDPAFGWGVYRSQLIPGFYSSGG